MSNEPASQVSVDDRETSPGWHLRAVIIIVIVLAIAYEMAVRMVLK